MATTTQPLTNAASPSSEPAPSWNEQRGQAMGTTFHVIVGAVSSTKATELADHATERIRLLEDMWSRFIPTSEISDLNLHAGEARRVSGATLQLVERGIEAWHRTGHVFDPSVLSSICALGYDRTFVTIEIPDEHSGENPRVSAMASSLRPGCEGIVVDRENRTVMLPRGIGFDPGGLGKGLAADLIAEELLSLGAHGAVVNIGGDLRCAGSAPTDSGWTVEVGDAVAGVPPKLVTIKEGGIASSTCRRRRWQTPSGEAHHLIDPTTGKPAKYAADLVTVLSATACDAETIATAVAVRAELATDRRAVGAAVIVRTEHDGHQTASGSFEAFVR